MTDLNAPTDFPELIEWEDSPYGYCPDCGHPLSNWGAASHGDGDIFDEIGCDECEEVIEECHASYCTCNECASSIF